MSIQHFESKARMSRAVVHNNTVYLCGQVAKDTSHGIAEQTRTTIEKVEELLAKVGSDKSKLLSVTIYVRTMDDFAEMNKVWDAWVADVTPPARACVQAHMAREEILVEMSVTAAV
ncbi:RidA family protein [Agarivorans sp. DSG3-1]|uniref:RidA family protein n=1 Tax=Agarivorans sp. DSG3-1 TaxID=3342249 RepID=UPI00398F5363